MGRGECRCVRKGRPGSDGLQREFTRQEANKCVAKLENRKAAGANEIVYGVRYAYHDGYVV